MSTRFWIAILGLFAIGFVLAWPHLHHTYLGAWISGTCFTPQPPDICTKYSRKTPGRGINGMP